METHRLPPKTKTRVLILGGGFGGIYTAIHLEKLLGRSDDVEVTLVARENFLLFTPMLHEVAASDVELSNIVSPIRKLLRRTAFFQGDVLSIDLSNRRVEVRHGTDDLGFSDHSHALSYDHLVLGFGCVTSYYGLPGVEEHSQTMKSLDDAIRLRGRMIAALEQADTECGAGLRDQLMTVVVVGGGFAGAETIGSINDFVRESLRFYPNIPPEKVRMVLVHPGPVILPELGESLGSYAQKKLNAAGVEIRTGAKVTSATDQGVTLSDGSAIATSTIIWTAGTAAHPMLATLPLTRDRGRVMVDPCLRAMGGPEAANVWSLGDCAVVPNVDDPGKCHPPTAQHAIRQGRTLARNITAVIRGKDARPFRFKTIGLLAAIGRRAGVAQVMGVNFSGLFAWLMWRAIYLSKLPRLEKKLRVLLDWLLDLFFTKDTVQYLCNDSRVRRRPNAPNEVAQPAPAPINGIARGVVRGGEVLTL